MGTPIPAFWVKCGACDQVWKVCDLPMPITRFSRLAKKAQCPQCGAGSKEQYTATGQEIANVTASPAR